MDDTSAKPGKYIFEHILKSLIYLNMTCYKYHMHSYIKTVGNEYNMHVCSVEFISLHIIVITIIIK